MIASLRVTGDTLEDAALELLSGFWPVRDFHSRASLAPVAPIAAAAEAIMKTRRSTDILASFRPKPLP
jgi:hypothetical protein